VKVLDLQCDSGHVFEGWFGSEHNYQDQLQRGLLSCPTCNSASVAKKLSAPRLNLRKSLQDVQNSDNMKQLEPTAVDVSTADGVSSSTEVNQAPSHVLPAPSRALQAEVLAVMREVWNNTEDVGNKFADQARAMHYGETAPKAIRGQASREQAIELVEEGIDVMPVLVPESFKNPLH
jgi:hypothetical protein